MLVSIIEFKETKKPSEIQKALCGRLTGIRTPTDGTKNRSATVTP